MGTRRCMNGGCGAAAAAGGGGEWRKGWALRSGGFATLCDKCGMAYEQSVFCDLFHQKESGWRECISCGKRLHCGCIASKSSMDLLDIGGVQCNSCIKNSEMSFVPSQAIQDLLPQPLHSALALSARSPKDEKANDDFVASLGGRTCELRPTSFEHKMDDDTVSKGNMFQLDKNIEINGQNSLFPTGSFGYIKREQMMLHTGELGTANFSNRDQGRNISSQISPQNGSRDERTDNMPCGSPTQTCLSISLGNPSRGNIMESSTVAGSQHVSLPLPGAAEEGRDQTKTFSAFQQVQRSRNLLPKPPKAAQGPASEASKEVFSNMRVARPPGEGRGRNQLLPRYWPRITEQELQQISGDSNSTIVPLFEKVLSASDAGRIGRLVLPKACAEAYFPPISQPEGLPLKIQDSKGKDWHFQFRFWPNNNSRMYVLEGVTPCIQSLQLQAGDTVTFSRIDPEGKLVMGFRKATNSVPLQDSQITAIANAALGNDTFFSGIHENLPIVSGYSGLLQSLKGTTDPHLSCLSEQLNSADGDISWLKTDMHGGRPSEGLLMQNYLVQDKKRSRNIGCKSKRLHMDNEDALELMLSWEEAQDLLRPPPSVKPSIVMIEDHEFEEYEDPPVFGKRTIFTARTSGGLDQWMQCDDCFKWRRLPMDVLVPAKWTCAENIWDQKRSSCSAPDELSPRDVHSLLQQNADILKRRRTCTNSTQNLSDLEVAGLDALASAAALGEAAASPSMPTTAATTTKHPRHRPGCTCIVCIQPPSGKGPKHNPSCTCNVCMTVKRRFKTLMLRKKKRQSEREEAEASKRLAWGSNKEDIEGSSSSARSLQLPDRQKEAELVPEYERAILDNLEEGKGHILDLNCQPERDVEQQAGSSSARMSMLSLLEVANRPLENYLKKNGLTSLTSEQQVSSSSVTVPQATGESEGRTPDESYFSPAVREQEAGVDEGCCSGDKDKSDVA